MIDENFSETELPSNMDDGDNTDTEETLEPTAEKKETALTSDISEDEECEAEKKEEIAANISLLLQVIFLFCS